MVQVTLSAPNILTTGSLVLNGTQIMSLADFANGVTEVDKFVPLLASNTFSFSVAGTRGQSATLTVYQVIMPTPSGLTPNPLALNAGDSGTLTASLSPTPTAAGTLEVTSSNPAVATVPGSIAFASGQASVAIPVTAVAGGSATITASANGGQASSTVNVNALPTVSLTSPTAGSVYSAPATIALTASASDSDGTVAQVDFFDGATPVGTVTAAPYSVTLSNVAAGTHSYSARATDNLGATSTSTAVSVTVDAPPTVTISSPANGAVFAAGANITIAATATDSVGNVAKVDFYQGTTLLGTATTAPYTFTWTNVPAGSYSLTAVATNDGGGTATSAAVSITVNPAGASIYYIETDHLNTPRLIQDQAGNAVWRNDNTEPFGDSVPNGDPNRTGSTFEFLRRFAGQYFSDETNLAYNYFRNYDPGLGRYVEAGPIGIVGGINVYLYAYARPLNFTDGNGLNADAPSQPWDLVFPNGNVGRNDFTEQDWVCSGFPFNLFNSNPCTKNCCVFHDACFQQNGCNAYSWLYRESVRPCQKCNSDVVKCLFRNWNQTACVWPHCPG